MGLFSGVKDLAAPLIGAGIGALIPGGGALASAIGAGIGFNISGASAQADALEAAGKIQEANALRQEIRAQQYLQETAGFRELAREQIPGLRAEAAAAPGTSPLFRRAFERGGRELRGQFSGVGAGDSSALGIALGEFGANLTAADINRITNLRRSLASGATTGFGPALGASQLAQAAAGGQAQNLITQGAVRGGTFGDIGQSLLTLPLLSRAGLFRQQPGGGGTTGIATGGAPGAPAGGLLANYRR
jgi:hypothetical protein